MARLLICKFNYYLLLRFSQKHLFRVWLTVANISKMSISLCRLYCWVSSLVYWLMFASNWETPLCSAFGRSWRHFFYSGLQTMSLFFCPIWATLSCLWWWYKRKRGFGTKREDQGRLCWFPVRPDKLSKKYCKNIVHKKNKRKICQR